MSAEVARGADGARRATRGNQGRVVDAAGAYRVWGTRRALPARARQL